jgi:hypothetical protein
MAATRPIQEQPDPPAGIQADDADQLLAREAARASRSAPSRTGSGNGRSAPAVAGATRVRGGGF